MTAGFVTSHLPSGEESKCHSAMAVGQPFGGLKTNFIGKRSEPPSKPNLPPATPNADAALHVIAIIRRKKVAATL